MDLSKEHFATICSLMVYVILSFIVVCVCFSKVGLRGVFISHLAIFGICDTWSSKQKRGTQSRRDNSLLTVFMEDRPSGAVVRGCSMICPLGQQSFFRFRPTS